MKEYMQNVLNEYPHFSYYFDALCDHLETRKVLFIPPNRRETMDNLNYFAKKTAEYIFQELSEKGWDYKVVFSLPCESFQVGYMKYVDLVVKILIKDYQLAYDQFSYFTGAADNHTNRRIYYKHCVEANHLPLKLHFINTFEVSLSHCCIEDDYEYGNVKEKKILFLNKVARPHRIVALGQLIKRNLLDKTYLSFVCEANDILLLHTHKNKNYYPNLLKESVENIRPLSDKFPINLSLKDDFSNMQKPSYDDYVLFNNSLFSLISETLYCNSHGYVPHDVDQIHCYESHFFTEKTFRAIRFKHPFLVLSTPYFLEGLRFKGYKTFHPYIDESYDRIKDEEERMLAVMDEVERLSNMTEDQTLEWLNNVRDICHHNYQVLKDKHTYLITST